MHMASNFMAQQDRSVRPCVRKALEIGCVLGLVLTVLLTAAAARYREVCDQVCADTLRLHILANSDTLEDQLLKLRVRDAILEQMTGMAAQAQSKQQAIEAVQAALPALQRTAQQTLRRAGSTQTVYCRLEEAAFDAREYDDFWLPAGNYTALRIELGDAAGHNWFCVLYPALCVGMSGAEYCDDAENALVFGGYQVRFALMDTARSVWRSVRGAGESAGGNA